MPDTTTNKGDAMNLNGFEIERKFLIRMPEPEVLEKGEMSEIRQTYLLGEPGTTERVRRRRRENACEYTHTIKRKLSNVRRLEDESIISAEEYRQLLERADPERRSIEKRRYCIENDGLLWELDIFPFWTDRAILELEISGEDQQFTLPDFFRLIREVTEDPRYTNAALSLEIVTEDLPE